MRRTHLWERDIRTLTGKTSFARWSVNEAESLVVFVHGWNSSAAGWNRFQDLIAENLHDFEQTDLIFYQYDGLFTGVNKNVQLFLQFVRKYLANPAKFIGDAVGDSDVRRTFEYKNILLAGHSMGAVVIRKAMLDAHNLARHQQLAWLRHVHMLFFAPAQAGARLARLAVSDLIAGGLPLLSLVGLAASTISPPARDLQLESELLKNLRDQIDEEIDAEPEGERWTHLRALKVFWAADDLVVEPENYAHDINFEVAAGADHRSICKPRDVSDLPYTEIFRALSGSD